jgi:acetyl esterase
MALQPYLFDPEAIDPETRQLIDLVERALAAAPRLDTQEPARIRADREAGQGAFGPVELVDEAQWRQIDTAAGPQRIRVIVPERVEGVYLHLHGGGWTLGAPHHHDVRNLAIATQTNLAVVSAAYRLAPEAPYPAGPDDCERAALWLLEHARAEFGSERLWIGGESAGAHLAAVTLARLRDRNGDTGFAGANLVYGCFDLTGTPSVRNWGERNLILNTPIIEWFFDHFVPDTAARRGADVSPLFGDLRGLPPAIFTVGTLDPLLDDTLFMAQRWIAAGNRAELQVMPGGFHGFNAYPGPLTSRAHTRIDAFLAGTSA